MFLFLCENLKKKYRQILASSKPLFFINPIGILEGILVNFFFGGGRRGHLGKFSNKKGGNLVKIVCVGEEEGIYVNFPTKRKKKKPNTEKVNHDRRAECSD